MVLLKTLGIDISVVQNKNIETQRDTSIKDFNITISNWRMLITLKFNKLDQVSIGGVQNPDFLNITLTDANMFGFNEKEYYDADIEKNVMLRPILKLPEPMLIKIPR
jgi:hypothetical protein